MFPWPYGIRILIYIAILKVQSEAEVPVFSQNLAYCSQPADYWLQTWSARCNSLFINVIRFKIDDLLR